MASGLPDYWRAANLILENEDIEAAGLFNELIQLDETDYTSPASPNEYTMSEEVEAVSEDCDIVHSMYYRNVDANNPIIRLFLDGVEKASTQLSGSPTFGRAIYKLTTTSGNHTFKSTHWHSAGAARTLDQKKHGVFCHDAAGVLAGGGAGSEVFFIARNTNIKWLTAVAVRNMAFTVAAAGGATTGGTLKIYTQGTVQISSKTLASRGAEATDVFTSDNYIQGTVMVSWDSDQDIFVDLATTYIFTITWA